jgi:hypothetical protein
VRKWERSAAEALLYFQDLNPIYFAGKVGEFPDCGAN